MASMVMCTRCGDENPDDARFCIGCGANMARPSTGPTVKLAGPVCQTCQTANPAGAHFCVVCGRGMAGAAGQPAAAARPPRTAPLPPPAQHHPYTAAPAPVYQAPARRCRRSPVTHLGWPFWAIGIFVLLVTNLFWPGILILAGISTFVNGAQHHSSRRAVKALVWLVGLALLFKIGFWPGILVLVATSCVVDRMLR